MLALHDRKEIACRDALSFEAPYLIEKLLKECIVQTPEEGALLFGEVLRYLVLDRNYRAKRLEMCSRRIDEVWHQFVLFTSEYTQFCKHHFGEFVHHFPGNAPKATPTHTSCDEAPPTDYSVVFATLKYHYEELYGEPLPDVWCDPLSIHLDRRIIRNRDAGPLAVHRADGELTLRCARGEVLTVNDLAEPALAFVTQVSSFYVRELPGDLSDDEKVGLVEMLLRRRLLQLAS